MVPVLLPSDQINATLMEKKGRRLKVNCDSVYVLCRSPRKPIMVTGDAKLVLGSGVVGKVVSNFLNSIEIEQLNEEVSKCFSCLDFKTGMFIFSNVKK